MEESHPSYFPQHYYSNANYNTLHKHDDDNDELLPGHRRKGSWSSDLVMCDGASDIDIDWLAAAAASRQQYGLVQSHHNDNALYSPTHEENDNGFGCHGTNEEHPATAEDDDEFDFQHLMNNADDDANVQPDSDDEIGDSEFEPYHDAETNRIIMRMRMGSLMDYASTIISSYVEEEDEDDLLNESLDDNTHNPNGLTPFEQSFLHMRESPDIDHQQQEPLFDQVSFTDPYNAWSEAPREKSSNARRRVFFETPEQNVATETFVIPEISSSAVEEEELPDWCSPPRIEPKIIRPMVTDQQPTFHAEKVRCNPVLQSISTGRSISQNDAAKNGQHRALSADDDKEALPPIVSADLSVDNSNTNRDLDHTSAKKGRKTLQDLLEGTKSDQQLTTDFNSNTMQDEVEFLLQSLQVSPVPLSVNSQSHIASSVCTNEKERLSIHPIVSQIPSVESTNTDKESDQGSSSDHGESPRIEHSQDNNDEVQSRHEEDPVPIEKGEQGRPKYVDWLARNKEWTKKRIRRNQTPRPESNRQDADSSIIHWRQSKLGASNLRENDSTEGADEEDKLLFESNPSAQEKAPVKQVDNSETESRVTFDVETNDTTPSLCLSCSMSESTIQEQSIDQQLAVFIDMIQNQRKPVEEVKKLMEQNSNLSNREVAAFCIGIQSKKKESEVEQKTLLSTKINFPSEAQADTQKDNKDCEDNVLKKRASKPGIVSSTQGSKMRDYASRQSAAFDENISNLMSIVKGKSSPRQCRDPLNEARTSISVMSTLSCRDLSIQRLKRRIALSSKEQEQNEVKNLLKELQDAQERQKRLEKQLNQAGIMIAEDISYDKAKREVARISKEMETIGSSQATHVDPKIQAKLRQDYFVLEQEMEKYMRALELTDEYLEEQERAETTFDEDNACDNEIALQRVWKHMPVDIRQRSVEEWLETRAPNGMFMTKPFLVKFSRTNILTLLRMKPDFIERAHPCNLEQRRVTGLTLTERRALQAFLQPIARKWRNSKDALTKRKWAWYCILRQTFKDHLQTYQHHVAKFGVSQDGSCGCPVGTLRCPVKANQKLNYFMEDYGYPSNLNNPEYESASEEQPASCKIIQSKKDNDSKGAKPPARSNLLAEISSLSQNQKDPKPQNKSVMDELKVRANKNTKQDSQRSSFLDEIASKASKHKNANKNSTNKDTKRGNFLEEITLRSSKQSASGKVPMNVMPNGKPQNRSLMDELKARSSKRMDDLEGNSVEERGKRVPQQVSNQKRVPKMTKPTHGNLMEELKAHASKIKK